MRVLVSGSDFPDLETFKRLILLADEVAFMDRPSVMFGNWGTIGRDSNIRQFKVDDSPIVISVHRPPQSDHDLYERYVLADLKNPSFLQAVFDGLSDRRFANKLIQTHGNYGDGRTGAHIVEALLTDPSVVNCSADVEMDRDQVYRFETDAQRKETFKHAAIEASVRVTSTRWLAGNRISLSDDPVLCRLIGLRTFDSAYVGATPRTAPSLGIAVATALIPDEALAKLTIGDVFDYRHKTKPAYEAWALEIDRLASSLADLDPATIAKELPRLLSTEVKPKIAEYRNEMKNARDHMFTDLVKGVAKWQMPSLSISYLAGLNLAGALTCSRRARRSVVPAMVDYYRAPAHPANQFSRLLGRVGGDV